MQGDKTKLIAGRILALPTAELVRSALLRSDFTNGEVLALHGGHEQDSDADTKNWVHYP